MGSINPALTAKYPTLFGHLDPKEKWHRITIPVTVCHRKWGNDIEWVLNSETGELYNFDPKAEIWGKMVGIAILRIPMTVVKTFYHMALPFSMTCAIIDGLTESQGKAPSERAWHCLTRCGQNLVDIVKTPIIGLALTVLFVVGAIFGPILGCTDFLYEIRGAIDVLINVLWWNETIPLFPEETKCMTSNKLLQDSSKPFEAREKIRYPENYNDDEKRLLHYVLASVGYQDKPSHPVRVNKELLHQVV